MANDHLTRALRDVLAEVPASRRELARAAGVDHTLLAHIEAGRRRATRVVVRKIEKALKQWGTDCSDGAKTLHKALLTKGD